MASQTRLKPTALTWLAHRDPERWIWPNTGKPHITQIARDAGISRVTLHRMVRDGYRPSQQTEDRLCDLAVSTGVGHRRAKDALFGPVEIEKFEAAA